MPAQNGKPYRRGLSRGQQRMLLWVPLVGMELVLLIISRQPEGGRDWPSLIALGLVAAIVYVGLWFALVKMTTPEQADDRTTDEKLADTGSRAALIYGDKEESECEEDT